MATIKLKRGQSTNLPSLNLQAGEPAFTLDSKKLYIGDGTAKVLINPDIGANEITDVNIGNRTIDQGIAAPVSNTGTLTQLFSFLAKIIKAITGKANWYDAPVKTLEGLNTDISNHTGNNTVHVTAGDKTNWADKYTKNEVDNKLSALETNIDWKESVNTFSDIATTYPNPQDGWTVNVKDTDYTYRYSGAEWIAISANAIPKSTAGIDGLMAKEDKAKLDGVAAGANNYTHPASHVATMITQSATHRFVSDTEKTAWNGKAELNSPGFTGTPTAPTPGSEDNSTKLATTAYVRSLGYIPASGAIDGGTF
ncbi:MAG: hypothetical protein PHI24_10175 [Desulfitobacteriaceae bacterium]|jgi:hypothetical protein|nr:hypothetical protein [Desulfitobacteriaceae bacterium]